MPDSEAWRTIARVPRRSGAWSESIDSVISACPSAREVDLLDRADLLAADLHEVALHELGGVLEPGLDDVAAGAATEQEQRSQDRSRRDGEQCDQACDGCGGPQTPPLGPKPDPPDQGRENVSVRRTRQTRAGPETCGHVRSGTQNGRLSAFRPPAGAPRVRGGWSGTPLSCCSWRRWPGCGGTTVREEPSITVSGGEPRRDQAPGRARLRGRAADRGRHARPGLEPVLGDRAHRRRGRGAPDERAGGLRGARRLLARAHDRADRRGGRDQARRARRVLPRARPGARDPARRQGRDPRHHDQLRQRRVPLAGRARPRRPARGPRRAGRRKATRARGRAQGPVRQPAGRQRRPRRPLRRPGARGPLGGRQRARARHRRPEPRHPAARSPARSPPARSTASSPTNATGGLLSVDARRARPAATAASRSPPSTSAPTPCAPSRRASCCSRSTSSPTSRATSRWSCSPTAPATACSRPRATCSPRERTSSPGPTPPRRSGSASARSAETRGVWHATRRGRSGIGECPGWDSNPHALAGSAF